MSRTPCLVVAVFVTGARVSFGLQQRRTGYDQEHGPCHAAKAGHAGYRVQPDRAAQRRKGQQQTGKDQKPAQAGHPGCGQRTAATGQRQVHRQQQRAGQHLQADPGIGLTAVVERAITHQRQVHDQVNAQSDQAADQCRCYQHSIAIDVRITHNRVLSLVESIACLARLHLAGSCPPGIPGLPRRRSRCG